MEIDTIKRHCILCGFMCIEWSDTGYKKYCALEKSEVNVLEKSIELLTFLDNDELYRVVHENDRKKIKKTLKKILFG